MVKGHQMALVLAVAANVTAGCSKSENWSRMRPPRFELPSSSVEKLRKVGCDSRMPDLKCTEVSESGEIAQGFTRLNALKRARQQAAEQKSAIDEVQSDLTSMLKKGSYDPGSVASAEGFIASLNTRSAVLAVQISEFDSAAINEENYQTVLGFECTGSYQRGGQELKSEFPLLKALTGAKKMVRDDDAHYTATVSNAGDGGDFLSYELADHGDPKMRQFHQLLITDGEILASSTGDARATMNCARKRVFGSQRPFSDRTLERTYYYCSISSKFHGKTNRTTMAFPVSSNVEKDRVELFAVEPVDEKMEAHPEARGFLQKYMVTAALKKGMITFAIQDLAAKKVIGEVSTLNSMTIFSLSIEDHQDISFSLNCGTKKN